MSISAILSIIASGFKLLTGYFTAKQSPQEIAAKNASVEQADGERNKRDTLDAFKTGNSEELK